MTIAATESFYIVGDRGRLGPNIMSTLSTDTSGRGNAGRLFISAPTLHMDDGRILAHTLGGGNAGDLDVRVERLMLTGGAQIFNGTGTIEHDVTRGIDGPGHGGI